MAEEHLNIQATLQGLQCDDNEMVTAFEGHALAAFVEALGKPDNSDEFDIADGVPEFRIQTLNIPREPGQSYIIREHTWEMESCRLTIWGHKIGGEWEVYEALYWHEGTDF